MIWVMTSFIVLIFIDFVRIDRLIEIIPPDITTDGEIEQQLTLEEIYNNKEN